MKHQHYANHAVALRAELAGALSREQIREFHRKSPARHLAVAARQFGILAIATAGLIRFEHPLVWLPLAVVQGFTIFNFTILLHEVVHRTIFQRARSRAYRVLGFLYAVPSGISPSQFTRWHLDHHAELGSDEDDPKRAHLSPKVNNRWYKLLYCPRRCSSSTFAQPVANRPGIPSRFSGPSAGNAGCPSSRMSRRSGCCATGSAPTPRFERSRLLRLSGGVHAEPAGPALRYRCR